MKTRGSKRQRQNQQRTAADLGPDEAAGSSPLEVCEAEGAKLQMMCHMGDLGRSLSPWRFCHLSYLVLGALSLPCLLRQVRLG